MSIEKMDTHEIVNMYQEKFGIHFKEDHTKNHMLLYK